jgi:glycerol-3-phosphate dehydrogenase (NAD(P)+)
MATKKNSSITVIGSGSWATALVKILSHNVQRIHWWVRSKETAEFIRENHHNPNYITDVVIDVKKVSLTNNIAEAVQSSEIIILAVPSAFLKDALGKLPPGKLKDKIVFSAIKGIVPDDLMIVGEFMNKKYKVPLENFGVITGPCHAEEVAMERLSYLTLASQNSSNTKQLSSLLQCRYIRTTLSDDIYGTEYSAVMKNVIAIACGIYHGLGYGDNFQAVLVANAIQEIKRFVDAVHPITRDINDSAYLGDLLVTCYSQFSRNRTFGTMIGKGYSVKNAQLEMNMIAEGYYAAKCIHQLNKKLKTKLPVTDAVYEILYEKKSAVVLMKGLTEKLA